MAALSDVLSGTWQGHTGVTPPDRLTTTISAHTARTCPTCNGSGINPILLTKVCPKCNGEKVVPGA